MFGKTGFDSITSHSHWVVLGVGRLKQEQRLSSQWLGPEHFKIDLTYMNAEVKCLSWCSVDCWKFFSSGLGIDLDASLFLRFQEFRLKSLLILVAVFKLIESLEVSDNLGFIISVSFDFVRDDQNGGNDEENKSASESGDNSNKSRSLNWWGDSVGILFEVEGLGGDHLQYILVWDSSNLSLQFLIRWGSSRFFFRVKSLLSINCSGHIKGQCKDAKWQGKLERSHILIYK